MDDRVLQFIEQFTTANGYPPSYGEIDKGLGRIGQGRLSGIFRRLIRRGLVKRIRTYRGYWPTSVPRPQLLPLGAWHTDDCDCWRCKQVAA